MEINPQTVFLILTLILAVMGVAQVVFARLRPHDGWFQYWAGGNFTCMIGVLLLSQHGRLPPVFSIATADMLVVLSWGCCWSGCRVFAGRRPKSIAPAILAGTVFGLLALPSPISAQLSGRLLVLSAALDILVLATGWVTLDIARRERLSCAWLATVMAAVIAVMIAVRGCWAVEELRPGMLLTQDLLGVLLLPSVVVVLVWNMCLTVMTAERMRGVLLRAANRDELTEVLNRRGFKAALWRMLRHKHDQCPGALVLIDLDYLKVTNDRFGHAAGDRLLRCLAGVVNAQLRTDDAIGRIGGDEFAVALSAVDELQAMEIAERLRRAYADAAAFIAHDFEPTISMGIAVIGDGDSSIDVLMARADKALYEAKAAGRGRVLAWSALSGVDRPVKCPDMEIPGNVRITPQFPPSVADCRVSA